MLVTKRPQFRELLPIVQSVLAIFFGTWGLCLRNALLNRPFWGNSTYWDSTARFHVWPWPLKFAVILNLPAFVAGVVSSAPLYIFWPKLPAWVSFVAGLPFVALLWYSIGFWLDRMAREPERPKR